uniref:GTD-binding domain-containing protein n=1 Tax=Leersia perrieri TaxID=77586 RepID=A0A0D9X8B9_9ORYZ
MAEIEDTQLQKAIFAQYIMMKKLFMELEEEREASATAASAALSMIRKLQKEKEEQRMEAWQYKRIVEEKISHNDKALEILHEVLQQKELENSYLRNQLLVYKHKLLDVGVDDCDIADETITNNIPLFESKAVENLCRNIKRNFSLPTLQLNKLFAEKDADKNVEAVQSAKSRLGGHICNSSEKELKHSSGDANDFNALEVVGTEEHGEEPNLPSSGLSEQSHPLEGSSSSLLFSVSSNHKDICSERVIQVGENAEDTRHGDQPKQSHSYVETEEVAGHPLEESSTGSSFSTPSNQRDTSSERAIQVGENEEDVMHGDQLKESHSYTEMKEVVVHPVSNIVDTPKIEERRQGAEESSCTGNEIITKEPELSPKAILKERRPHALSKLSATRKVGSMNNLYRNVHNLITEKSSTPRAKISTPRAGVERTRSRLKRVQSEKMIELNDHRKSKEQIIMLKEVYEQLDMIESHMRPSTSQETPRNDQYLDSVLEAALSFSI